MDSFVLTHLLQSGLNSLTAAASSAGNHGPAAGTELLASLASETQKQESMKMMQMLSDEAKRALAVELEKQSKTLQALEVTLDKAQQKDDAAHRQAAGESDSKKRKKDPTVEPMNKTQMIGSVGRFLKKSDDDQTTPTAKKEGQHQTTYVKPKAKHRPVSLIHTVHLEHGVLEIFSRFRPAEGVQAEVNSHPSSASTDLKVPSPPPFPPPAASQSRNDLPLPPPPPLPPPTTPHPEMIQKVAKQMVELKETLGDWQVLGFSGL